MPAFLFTVDSRSASAMRREAVRREADYSQCPDCFYKESGCRPEIGRVRLREGERGVFDARNPMPSLMLLDELKKVYTVGGDQING